nr:hypothetical protein [Patescibacteria group bacterium]
LNLPVVEIISGPAYYSSSTEASFLFTANCVPSLFKYSFNNEDFQVSDLSESISEGRVFNEESNILEIKIKDRLGRSASTSFEWIIDTTPPEVIFGDTTFSENEILINWEIASSTRDGSPFKYFELEEFIDGAFFDSFIVEANIFSRAISTQDNMSFRIRAVDMAGNIGEWVDKVIIILPESNHILISEVGIIGTEFIELYNPTEEDFLISSWYLAYYPAERDWYNPYRLLEIRPAEIESRGFF